MSQTLIIDASEEKIAGRNAVPVSTHIVAHLSFDFNGIDIRICVRQRFSIGMTDTANDVDVDEHGVLPSGLKKRPLPPAEFFW